MVDQKSIRVALIASTMMGWALQQLVSASPHLRWVGTAAGFKDAQDELVHQADVLVVDLEDRTEVPDLVQFVSGRILRVLVVTNLRDTGALDPALLAGLHGIVRKSDPPATLLTAIERVHQGELWLDRGATSRMFMHIVRHKAAQRENPEGIRIATLTGREREAIAALVADTSVPAKVIASRLSISSHTLRNHLTSIYRKLQVNNRLDLYAYAARNDLGRQTEAH
ncbi:MAG TPA: response regulator transcription factor [Ramlibacter sp.]|uniref:response regulator transcription factor n=1 Tax=Ramlibacter sp. TaxID=1917967 RepID=UPI002D7365FC|nr:response regulator transcription factor [Ramlibacter sp.]HZY18401.1 response regulator transcription factor [Ramlibacter sp.]